MNFTDIKKMISSEIHPQKATSYTKHTLKLTLGYLLKMSLEMLHGKRQLCFQLLIAVLAKNFSI